jgi:hypothetical protein
LRVVNLAALAAGNTTYLTLEAPVDDVTEDHILGGVTWPTNYEVAAHWLNRRQNYTVLRICNVQTGVCQVRPNEIENILGNKICTQLFYYYLTADVA